MKIKFLIEYLFVRTIVSFIAFFSRTRAQAIGKMLGQFTNILLPSRFRIARKNLIESFPGISEERVKAIVEHCWENLGEGLGEFVKMPGMSKEELYSYVELEGLEGLHSSYRAGKGVLIFTAHYGAWELGSKFWPYSGFRTAVVARRIKNPYVDNLVTGVRSADGVKVILARDAVRESIRWLKQGNLLAVLIDHRVTEGGLQVPFFGRAASTTSLPALLALRYSIPVHPVHCWREGEKVKIHIAPAMDFSDLTQSQEDIFEATLRMNAIVEDWVRERPECWLWIHNRWKM